MTQAQTERYMTAAEAADVLGVSRQAVYAMARDVNRRLVPAHLPGVTGNVGMLFAQADVWAEKARRARLARRGKK